MGTFPATGMASTGLTVRPQRFKRPCAHSGKVRWLSEADAELAVDALGGTGGCYLCLRCQSWHVTRRRLR